MDIGQLCLSAVGIAIAVVFFIVAFPAVIGAGIVFFIAFVGLAAVGVNPMDAISIAVFLAFGVGVAIFAATFSKTEQNIFMFIIASFLLRKR